ncbi:hypothetical protein PHMEG_0003239 [Phytophthora megakarya]|uniref:Uncharacterized protein n=1 Tax=Phytophthora megakarya TaxID=4795 RepID=A0A225WYL0_9STRA|nr:hypothetical protein PHMEG_0003239 [Phytophthora megakarya]
MPHVRQENLAAAGVVYDSLSDLVLYFSRLEKAEQQAGRHDKNKGKMATNAIKVPTRMQTLTRRIYQSRKKSSTTARVLSPRWHVVLIAQNRVAQYQ